jgi:hypothetical protein
VTIAAAIAAFDAGWIVHQATTPQFAYRRTLAVLGFWLERAGRSVDDDLDDLTPTDLRSFVAWHAGSGLVDDPQGSRKAAVHVARFGAWLGEHAARPELALDRDALRAIV